MKLTSELEEFLKILSIEDIEQDLITSAITHKSFANEHFYTSENTKKKSNNRENIPVGSYNERLEFLGDSILGFYITHLLYQLYPNFSEGKLSMLKARSICEPTLAEIGHSLSLEKVIRLGKGAELGNIQHNNAIIANTVEAIIGAIFLFYGLHKTSKVIEQLWKPYLDSSTLLPLDSLDYKSILQETSIKKYKKLPTYTLFKVYGEQHQKIYKVSVYTKSKKQIAYGEETSIKKSEQKAARNFLEKFFSNKIR